MPSVPRRQARPDQPEGRRQPGQVRTQALLESKEGITRLRGRTYPFRRGVLVPTYHPAAVLRGGAEPMAQMRADLVRAKKALRS